MQSTARSMYYTSPCFCLKLSLNCLNCGCIWSLSSPCIEVALPPDWDRLVVTLLLLHASLFIRSSREVSTNSFSEHELGQIVLLWKVCVEHTEVNHYVNKYN